MTRYAPVGWYCVRVDHLTREPDAPPLVTMHARSWAFCRSGAPDEEHNWAPTRGVSVKELHQDPRRASSGAARSQPLWWVDDLREELRETLACTSFVVAIDRRPMPLRIAFDEPHSGEENAWARAMVDLADPFGSVGRVTVLDRRRSAFSEGEIELLHAIVAPYIRPIREWLNNPAGMA